MCLGEIIEPDIADCRLTAADHDRRAIEQQAVDEVGLEEGGGGLSAALDEQMIDAVQGGNVGR